MTDEYDFLIFSFRDVHVQENDQYVLKYEDPLAKEICQRLNKKLSTINFDQFLNKEHSFTINENVRKKDVYILFNPDLSKDIDGEIYRLLMLVATIHSCRAGEITVIAPCLLYSRQDQTYGKRQLISASFLAQRLQDSGANHLITIGLHSAQIEGYYKSIDHLKTRPIFSHYLQRIAQRYSIAEFDPPEVTKVYRTFFSLISPDAGGLRGVNELRRELDPERKIPVGFVQKERIGVNISESGRVIGEVKGKVVVLYDDIIDSGGTLFKAAEILESAGAIAVIACVDHPLGNSKPGEKSFEDKLAESLIDELVVTNTVPEFCQRVRNDPRLAAKTTILSIAPLITQAIIRNQKGYTIRDMVQQVGKENLYEIIHEKKNQ